MIMARVDLVLSGSSFSLYHDDDRARTSHLSLTALTLASYTSDYIIPSPTPFRYTFLFLRAL